MENFNKLTIMQKHKEIETILDTLIRPYLMLDEGNLEVIDIKENDLRTEVYIKYLGACAECSAGVSGTLKFIENALRRELDENIAVLPEGEK
jgi:NifU-like protein